MCHAALELIVKVVPGVAGVLEDFVLVSTVLQSVLVVAVPIVWHSFVVD